MRIEVDRLSEAGESLAHTYGAEELAINDERASLRGGAKVMGQASRQGPRVRLSGAITAAVEIQCDRCLRPVVVPVETEFDVTYIPAAMEAETPESAELHAEDLDSSVYEGDAVDLDEVVREQVLLTLPSRFICQEECRGLCPVCGIDLNTQTCACEQSQTDPRWAALAALKQGKG